MAGKESAGKSGSAPRLPVPTQCQCTSKHIDKVPHISTLLSQRLSLQASPRALNAKFRWSTSTELTLELCWLAGVLGERPTDGCRTKWPGDVRRYPPEFSFPVAAALLGCPLAAVACRPCRVLSAWACNGEEWQGRNNKKLDAPPGLRKCKSVIRRRMRQALHSRVASVRSAECQPE